MIKISIIIACLNAEKKLALTIDSILSQNYYNIEIIIIDGLSTDNTLQCLNRYKDKISILISEKDSGIANAWNKGLKYATGNIINFLNAGDYYEKNMLKKVLENCTRIEYIFIGYGDTIMYNSELGITKRINGYYKKSTIYLISGFKFMHPTVFFSKNVLDIIGDFNENKKIGMDTDWLIRAIKKKVKFININSVVFMEEGGISDKYKYTGMGEYLDTLVQNGLKNWQITLFLFFRFLGSFKLIFKKNIKE